MNENEKQINEAPTAEAEVSQQVETPKGRAAYRAKLKERMPDTNWDEMDDDALADQALLDYDEMSGKINEYEANNRKLGEMMEKNPQSADFLLGMANGEDFIDNLYKNFGEDIVEAMSDPDKLAELKAKNKESLEKAAKNKEIEAQWESNMQKSLETLQHQQDQMGLTDEEVTAGMDALEKVVSEYISGTITPETIKMFLKAINHDKNVAMAKREGEVNGRNAKIEETMRNVNSSNDGLPSLGGQGSLDGGGKAFSQQGGRVGSSIWEKGGFKRNNYE